ncbi:MAG TPA: neutral/alkaline non-lysosomal ceramidase N-terminal domain-containing protein [Cytophagaceae bacterium]|jgi:neutral ceramidase|nr:neutral/alkaline non-lysosomal ceramidase N-terminal domain-containing protein [Cytophagaceae bacterium]
MKSNNVLKWTGRIFVGLVAFFLLLTMFLFQKIDRTPYKEMPYYHKMLAQLDTFQLDTNFQKGYYLKAGWAKRNITPDYFPNLAGYGIREKANCLEDSVFVRTVVFSNGKSKVAYISVDLLIFPPIIEERIRKITEKLGYKSENLYLSATHTHSAPGGWVAGPAGKLLAGTYDEAYVARVVEDIILTIKNAEMDMEEAITGFGQIKASSFVSNRLSMPDSKVDPWIRIFKIKKKSGKEAAIIIYSAHANCLKMKYTCVSADYPGRVIHQLENDHTLSFAMYSAGMVGSHIPVNLYQNGTQLLDETYLHAYGDSIGNLISKNIDSIPYKPGNRLSCAVLDLPLREPHLKISKDWRVRPWVFDLLFGPYNPKIKLLKINDVLFIGTPCDFSGELMEDFEQICTEKKIQLVITSFNGGYIGYINVDKYYDSEKEETRNMNWFGPYNQTYFTEIILRILKKI